MSEVVWDVVIFYQVCDWGPTRFSSSSINTLWPATATVLEVIADVIATRQIDATTITSVTARCSGPPT